MSVTPKVDCSCVQSQLLSLQKSPLVIHLSLLNQLADSDSQRRLLRLVYQAL